MSNLTESFSRKMLREVLETDGGLAAVLKADMSGPATQLVFLPQRVTKDNVTNCFHQVTGGLPCQGARVNTIFRLGVKVSPASWLERALQACATCADEEGKALLQSKVQTYVDRMDIHTPLMYPHWGPQGPNPPGLLHLPPNSFVGAKFSRPSVARPPAADERRLDAQGLPIAAEQNGVAAYVDGVAERAACAFEMTFTFKFGISSQTLPGVFMRFVLVDREANHAFKALDTPAFRVVKGNLPYGDAKVPCDIAAWVKRDVAANGPPPELCMETVRVDLEIHACDPDPLTTAELEPEPFADFTLLDVDAAEEAVTGLTTEQILEAVEMDLEQLLAAADAAARLIPAADDAPDPKRQRLAAQSESAGLSSAQSSPVQRSLGASASASASASPATTYRSCAVVPSSPSTSSALDDEQVTYRGCSAGCCSDDAHVSPPQPQPAFPFRALGGVAMRGGAASSKPTPNAAEDVGRAVRRSLQALMARVRGRGAVSAADCWELAELRKRCAGLAQG